MSGYDIDHPEELKIQGQKTALAKSFLISLVAVWMIFVSSFLVWNGLAGAQTRNTLVDCTSPNGKCFQENQKRTALIIGQLLDDNKNTQRIILVASVCADQGQTQTYLEIKNCVEKELKNDAGN